jgi:hypothetical protein
VRMIERRQRADTHELLSPDLDDAGAGIVVEMRDDVVRHDGIAFALDCGDCAPP